MGGNSRTRWLQCRFKAGHEDVPSYGNNSGSRNFAANGRAGWRIIQISTNPVWHPGTKSVVTLHDLNFYLHPERFTRSFRLVQTFVVIPGARRAERVVTIFNHVFEQAKKHLGISVENLRMVHNGVKPLKSIAGEMPAGGRRLLCVG